MDERTGAAPAGRVVTLSRGLVAPYPEPANDAATRIGRANRRTDTRAEIRVRSALHRLGLRFRKDRLIRCGDVKVHADVVFGPARVAVFVDGCFWHSCPDHQHLPKRNRDYWLPKLAANVARDRRVDAALVEAGWLVVREWEHEHPGTAAARIAEAVAARRAPGRDDLGEVRGSPRAASVVASGAPSRLASSTLRASTRRS